ncbi:MAG: ribosome maturation factor RimM [Caldilinea sp.]
MLDHARSTPSGKSSPRQGQIYRVRNQEVVVPDGYIAVGHIVNVHGLRGEIRVEPYTDFPERFAPGERLLMGVDLVEVKIESVRPHKKFLLIQLDGVADRTAAEQLRGQWLFIDEEDSAELEEGVYWIHDIIGLQVVEEAGNQLGDVVDVLATGANEVYVVRPRAGQNRGQDILLPVIPEVILAVDLAGGVMTVRLLEGLVNPETVD